MAARETDGFVGRVANNLLLTAVARVVMVLGVPVTLYIITSFVASITQMGKDIQELELQMRDVVATSRVQGERISTLETRMNTDIGSYNLVQREISALAATQRAMNATLERALNRLDNASREPSASLVTSFKEGPLRRAFRVSGAARRCPSILHRETSEMSDPIFGIGITRNDNEPRPAVKSDMSVVGLVGTAPDALDDVFPIDTPVLLFSDDAAKLTALGNTGTLPDAIAGINDQLGEFQVAARVVVVRVVDSGGNEDALMANVVGSQAAQSGIYALTKAGPMLGVIPRLIGVPGFTHQQEDTSLANPVCAALPAVLDKLLAHAVVDGPATSLQDFTDWRETLNSQRIIPLETAVKVGVTAEEKPGSPRVLGIAVRRDHEKGGSPFYSWANQPVRGIVGPSRAVDFSLTDGACEGQSILAQNGGIIVRGEMGVESAIGNGGFTYIGTDNAGEDDLWRFYNVTRGRDYIHLLFLKTLRSYLGRFNITAHAIQSVINTMNFALRDLKADGDILGYKVGFMRDQNSPEELRLGRFTVDFAAEEAPVLRYLGLRSARDRPALDALLNDLLASIDAAA
jgi:phage tail sheath protein FI